MSILEIKDLDLYVENTKILENINVEFEKGKVQALVGPNGAGKSSLAFSIMGLSEYQNTRGNIIYKGESIDDLSISERSDRGISLAWQEPARFEGLKVKDFINSASKKHKTRKSNDKNEKKEDVAKEVLKRLGMDPKEYLDREVDSSLSGGERKKIEMASILAMEPDLVLLDEPDSGIDVSSLERIFESINFLKEKGATVILITHSEVTLNQAEYAYLMCGGSIIDDGPIGEIRRYFEDECLPCDTKNVPEAKVEQYGNG